MSVIRVFLLEDHEEVRRGLRDLFESEEDFVVVGDSASAKDAAARIPGLRPDVAILDGRLPDGSGIDVCLAIRAADPSIRALILTAYDDDQALFAAVMAGAAGYLLKQSVGHELVQVVRKLAEGLPPHRDEPAWRRLLTPQERRILELVAEGLNHRQIGEQLFLPERTVRSHVQGALDKLYDAS